MADERPSDYERISITVPRELAEELRGMKQAHSIESVSAFASRAMAEQIDRERRHRESSERLRVEFGLDEEQVELAQQWADDVTNRRTKLSLQEYMASRRSNAA
jgi:metal-responsive CopG/Arc/MetJ family transcriptional regulator